MCNGGRCEVCVCALRGDCWPWLHHTSLPVLFFLDVKSVLLQFFSSMVCGRGCPNFQLAYHPSIQWLYDPNWAVASSFEVSKSHTYRHTVGLLWTSDQPVAETSTYTGQHKRETLHAPSGIRTRDPFNQAAVDLRL
jgi:hypothetical protein